MKSKQCRKHRKTIIPQAVSAFFSSRPTTITVIYKQRGYLDLKYLAGVRANKNLGKKTRRLVNLLHITVHQNNSESSV